MSRYSKTLGLLGILSLGLLGACSDQATERQYVIKFSHVVAANTPKGLAAELFKELVEQRLNGRVVTEIYPSGQLMSDDDSLEALAFNEIQMTAVSLSKYNRFTKKLQIFDLPFLFNDMEAVGRFVNTPEGQNLLTVLEDKGLMGLGFWPNGLKQLSANSPLLVPPDAKGVKFRIQESDVLEAQFLALDSNPQKLAFGEVYQALQVGTIDGQDNTWSNIYNERFYEVQEYITETNHNLLAYIWMVNTEFWHGLPPEIQSELRLIVDEVNAAIMTMAVELNAGDRAKILQDHPDKIISLTPEQLEQWRVAMRPVWDRFREEIGEEVVQAALDSNKP
ncbi:MAG: DctP family TRAP transporter solute-binding subunit [Proteobacteria bacterium]|jgi:C4-dicarboxylate-binding protein DctP|nr:DctP family TRAP transporter solute-binding subunit [Pseudomonadota bacterium]